MSNVLTWLLARYQAHIKALPQDTELLYTAQALLMRFETFYYGHDPKFNPRRAPTISKRRNYYYQQNFANLLPRNNTKRVRQMQRQGYLETVAWEIEQRKERLGYTPDDVGSMDLGDMKYFNGKLKPSAPDSRYLSCYHPKKRQPKPSAIII